MDLNVPHELQAKRVPAAVVAQVTSERMKR